MTLHIRGEQPGDEQAIDRVVTAAFAGHPHSDGREPRIIAGLRAAGELTVSLVAEDPDIVGHVAFSPVTIGDGSARWFGLGPVAVTPARQREGIGDRLVRSGLDRLRGIAASGCVVLGDPDYYRRFGFVADPALLYPGPPPGYFQSLVLAGPPASGIVRYATAFG